MRHTGVYVLRAPLTKLTTQISGVQPYLWADVRWRCVFDDLPFDSFALFEDRCSPAEVGAGWRHCDPFATEGLWRPLPPSSDLIETGQAQNLQS